MAKKSKKKYKRLAKITRIPSYIKRMEARIKRFEKISFPRPMRIFWITLFLFVILLILFFYSKGFFSSMTPIKCETAEEFVENANKCKQAVYTTKIGTSTMEMQILSGCRLKKTILELDETESEELRNFFAGKEMICDYDEDFFDSDFAYQISGPLDECKGSLVDAIRAII